jgi:uncharacterized membrane protein (UPF0127 family)
MMGSAEKSQISVQILKTQRVIADKCLVRVRYFDRLRGLIGTKVLEPGMGMYFPNCNSIHMWFMSIPIDVVFLRQGKVCSVHENVKPWRMLPLRNGKASETLELANGTIRRCGLQPGDEVEMSYV